MIGESLVKDPSLAPEGHRKIDWVAQHAPVLNKIAGEQLADGSLRGRKVAMTIHLEAKTAYLALLLSEAGAEVTVSGSNPLSTQDDVCAALAERGVRVFATHDPSEEDFEGYLHKTLETGPDLIVDDGAELVGRLIEHHPELVGNVLGASEETTTGVLKLRAMTTEEVLPFPVLAVNEAKMKHLFDNRYGTGHSSIVALLSNTNLFISVKVLGIEHFARMKDGALLANAGHYDHEFDLAALRETAAGSREVRRNITEYELPDGRRLHVLARGRLVNIAAADGHPVEIMDLTFAVQALAVHHLAKNAADMEPGLHTIPEAIDDLVARAKLDSLGVEPETLTEEQISYQQSWR